MGVLMSGSKVPCFVYKKTNIQTIKARGNWWRFQSPLWLDLDNMNLFSLMWVNILFSETCILFFIETRER